MSAVEPDGSKREVQDLKEEIGKLKDEIATKITENSKLLAQVDWFHKVTTSSLEPFLSDPMLKQSKAFWLSYFLAIMMTPIKRLALLTSFTTTTSQMRIGIIPLAPRRKTTGFCLFLVKNSILQSSMLTKHGTELKICAASPTCKK
tara:strand:+ start:222 stop:659 length:438 start_codon:yes stop_codon:yes gene_type:complete